MRTFPIFAFFFLVVPIIEIYLLIQVGSIIGAMSTILLVIATAVIGAYLLRQQGLSTLSRFQSSLANGVMPAKEMLEGILLLVGGVMLMTPGFVTDTMGFLCLLPFSRHFLVDQMLKRSAISGASVMGGGFGASGQQAEQGKGDVYEGEYSRKSDARIDRD